MVLESNKAWHVGNENSYTIGIEHEGYVSNAAWYTQALYQSSANLVKDITQSGYGINPKRTYDGAGSTSTQLLGNCIRIKGHQHYANQSHTDPGIHWNWNKYYGLINDTYTPTILTNPSGTFYDSGGPNGPYAADERSIWLIQAPQGSVISIQFSAFDLESSFDKLFIYNGATLTSPLLGTYTGNTLPPNIQSSEYGKHKGLPLRFKIPMPRVYATNSITSLPEHPQRVHSNLTKQWGFLKMNSM